MIEKPISFGKEKTLSGIVTLPKYASDARKTGVIMMNAAIGLRSGPFRMQVDLARMAAGLGFHALRFDLSGLGDSPVATQSSSAEEREVAEIKEAMDALQRNMNVQEFVLFGFCSGAVLSLKAALVDERIRGVIFVDGHVYGTRLFLVRRFFQRIFSLKRWTSYFRKRFSRQDIHTRANGLVLERASALKPAADDAMGFQIALPPRLKTENELVILSKRGVKQCHVYTNEADLYFNHQAQFFEMFPKLKGFVATEEIAVHYLKEIDHSFSIVGARKFFLSLILSWLSKHFNR